MWLKELLKNKHKIKIGDNLRFKTVNTRSELPIIGEISTIFKVKDIDEQLFWNDEAENYHKIIWD